MVPVSVATSRDCENNLHLVSVYSCLVVQNMIEVQLRVGNSMFFLSAERQIHAAEIYVLGNGILVRDVLFLLILTFILI